MDRALAEWLPTVANDADLWARFAKQLQKSYVVYGNMVLLPWGAFSQLPDVSSSQLDPASNQLQELYQLIARQLKATHVATTRPIPPNVDDDDHERDNVLRAPTNFLPLHGDFGPRNDVSDPPTFKDFDAAFWAMAKQNGIIQSWAPRWTMFSRGNISEKARILTLPSVRSAVQEGRDDGSGCAAVDLYVGIGYFAFSYIKAGVDHVLGWDLNPWSIEGCRRGANANRWTSRVVFAEELTPDDDRSRLIVFNESNVCASKRIEELKDSLPPVRHVNCGLLPTSQASWQTAINVLDRKRGGWIHVHENWAIREIDARVAELQTAFELLAARKYSCPASVRIEHVNRLKSYAPGVMHCVIDVHIAGEAV